MSKSVKRKLIKANRYEDIHRVIFHDIVNKISSDLKIVYFDGGTSKILRGYNIIKEAKDFFSLLSLEKENEMNLDDFDNFRCYVEDITDMKLHNFAISVAHRNNQACDMDDNIRVWLIIRNIFDVLATDCKLDSFKIPKGWKKISHDDNAKNINEICNKILNSSIGQYLKENPDTEIVIRKVKNEANK